MMWDEELPALFSDEPEVAVLRTMEVVERPSYASALDSRKKRRRTTTTNMNRAFQSAQITMRFAL